MVLFANFIYIYIYIKHFEVSAISFVNFCEDAERREKTKHQDLEALRKRIRRTEENIKQEYEQIAEWKKRAKVYQEEKELATRKKLSCQNQITKGKRKLPVIEELILTLEGKKDF